MLSASKIGISRTPVQETSIKAEGGMVEIKGGGRRCGESCSREGRSDRD